MQNSESHTCTLIFLEEEICLIQSYLPFMTGWYRCGGSYIKSPKPATRKKRPLRLAKTSNCKRAGWPRVLPPRGSHGSGRAYINASGSSTNRFAILTVPEAIQRSDVDMLRNLDVFGMFPSVESAGRRFAFLHWVLQGEFPSFSGTIKALRHPTAVSPRFVSFAWRYLGCTRCVRSLADE